MGKCIIHAHIIHVFIGGDYKSSHKPCRSKMRIQPRWTNPQVVERMALIADDQTAEVAEPGEEPLDLPAAAIAPERAAILRLGAHPPAAVGRDHLHPELRQGHVERVRIIRPVTNEALRQVRYEAGVERGRDEGNLMRRSRGGPDDTDGERKTSAVCHRLSGHEFRTFAPLGRSHTSAPLYIGTNVVCKVGRSR